jgi:hypothetical protein
VILTIGSALSHRSRIEDCFKKITWPSHACIYMNCRRERIRPLALLGEDADCAVRYVGNLSCRIAGERLDRKPADDHMTYSFEKSGLS